MKKVSQAEIAELKASGQFDGEWYRANYPDVHELRIDPAEHFLWIGRMLGRKPTPDISGKDANGKMEREIRSSAGALHLAEKTDGKGGPLAYTLTELNRDFTLELDQFQSKFAAARRRPPMAEPREPLAVVVPIFNAAGDVETCIDRLVAFTPPDVDILLIDDASTDPRISELLSKASTYSEIRVLRNKRNLGFTRSVNRGLTETAPRDVIILNSGARVTPGWVEGLRAAATSAPRIATVTPMPDRVEAFSAPEIGNDNTLPPGVDEITYARVFRRRSLGLYPVVPTGNSFCMLIRRACLEEIGQFDVDAFPRGYGEENDFCMRAGRAGWRHVIDDCTFIFHDRSKSFGAAKHDLLAAGRAIIEARYPEYRKAIEIYRRSTQMQLARDLASKALADCSRVGTSLPRILYVISTVNGGTPQTNRDLMTALTDTVTCFLLRCDSRKLELSIFAEGEQRLLREHSLVEPVDPITHNSSEYEAVLADWLDALDLDLVHIRHAAWHGLALARIAQRSGRAVVMSFHDYYTLCPTVKLINEDNEFCGGRCTKGPGDCQIELWPKDSLPRIKHAWVHTWRQRFGQSLSGCDAFVTTSDATRALLIEHLPSLSEDRFQVIPHGRNFQDLLKLRAKPKSSEPLRILVPGNIDEAKGLKVLYNVLAEDSKRDLEFHVLGSCDTSRFGDHPRLIKHGPYTREEFAAKVTAIRPHLGAVFSIWDETWCHTLTELWSVGLPAAVFDFPTVARRVRETGAGWVLDHQDIRGLCAELVRLGRDPREIARTNAALTEWRTGLALAGNTQTMSADYLDVYRKALVHRRGKARLERCSIASTGPTAIPVPSAASRSLRVAVVGPAQRSQTRGNASTGNRLWERTRNTLDRNVTYVRMGPEEFLASLRNGAVDAAVLQRTALPKALKYPLLAAMTSTGTPWLLDLDDELAAVRPEKGVDGQYSAYAPTLRQLIRAATLVTVSTESLRAKIAPLAPRRELLPNRLSVRLWRGLPIERTKDDAIRALYIATPTHSGDLALILPALDAFAKAEPRFRLVVIGITTEELPKWAERIVVPPQARAYHHFVPWLREQSNAFDFALAPLERTAFNECKSALKILECGALGLPILASDHPAYRDIAGDAPGVRLVPEGVRPWVKALMQQATAGRAAGADLRAHVLANYALEPSLPDFDRLLMGMVAHHN